MTTGNSYASHVASLARDNADQQEVQLIANNPGETMGYICEFFGMSDSLIFSSVTTKKLCVCMCVCVCVGVGVGVCVYIYLNPF